MPDEPAVAVFLGENFHELPGLQALEHEASIRTARTEPELARAVADAEVLFVWDFRTELVPAVWPSARRLRWIHAASAGVDAVIFDDVVSSDVTVTNSRGVFDQGIAEYVLGVILLFAKDLNTTLALQRRKIWRHRESELIAGQRLLVVGAGSVGRAVGSLAKAAGLEIAGVARSGRPDPVFGELQPQSRLHEELAAADYVAVTAPLTPETRGMFDRDAFASMRAGTRFINVGRGPIVDEDALIEALRSGHLSAAALDVFHTEPLPPEHPLWELPNVVISHHMAGDYIGWRDALVDLFRDNLRRYKSGDELRNVVDKEAAYAAGGRGS